MSSAPDPGATATPRGAWLALALVLLGAFALRTVGLDYLLPHLPEPDAYVTVQTDYFQGSYEEEKPFRHFFYYPLFLARVLLVVPGPVWNEGLGTAAPLEEHLAQAGDPFLRARRLVAFLAWGLIPATWWLARRFLGSWTATLAAAWVATASLHLLFSAQGRPHGAASTLTILAVVCALGLRARPTAWRYLLTGAVAALATCTLQNGAAAWLALAAAHLLRERGVQATSRKRELGRLGLAALPLALFVPLFYPLGLEKLPDTEEIPTAFDRVDLEGSVLTYGGHRIDLANFDGSGTRTIASTLWWHDPALAVMALVGLAAWILGRRRAGAKKSGREQRELFVVLAHALPYAFVICLYARSWDRYALPLYPYLACLAALGSARLGAWVTRFFPAPAAKRVALASIALAPLALPAWAAGHRARLRATPDTIEALAEWMRANVKPGERVAMFTHRLPLPLFYEERALEASHQLNDKLRVRWLDYQAHLPAEPRAEERFEIYHLETYGAFRQKKASPAAVVKVLDELGADYVVLEGTHRIHALPSMRVATETIAQRGELVARFLPRPGIFPDRSFRDYQDEPHALSRTLAAKRMGPVMEVYRWPHADESGR